MAGLGFVVIGVATTPGSTMATLMLNGLSSCARLSLNPSKAHFVAEYGPRDAIPNCPATDVILTMQPLCLLRIDGTTAFMHRTAPKKLVSIACRNALIGANSTGPVPETPALLTNTSI